MRFLVRALTEADTRDISAWRYPAPYDIYNENMTYRADTAQRALTDEDGMLCGFFAWGQEARIPAAGDVYEAHPAALDFGIGLRPGLTGRGLGLFACACALDWLRQSFNPPAFRLAVYEWNLRARRVYTRLGFIPYTKRGSFLIMRMDERPWIDATRPLENGMPVYPFDPGFDRHLHYRKEQNGWDMSVFSMSAHSGTHVDAPAHIGLAGGVEVIPLERLTGTVLLVDWREQMDINQAVSPRILAQRAEKGFTPQEAIRLVRAGITLLGVEGMSVGEGQTEGEVHRILLEAGVTVLENAAIETLAPGWYEMRCLPLRMPGSDGAPVRLLLRPEPEKL